MITAETLQLNLQSQRLVPRYMYMYMFKQSCQKIPELYVYPKANLMIAQTFDHRSDTVRFIC